MSNSVRPHRWQPTRLRCPWDSPGKNTEWVAISFSNAWKWEVKVKLLSRVRLLVTPWTAAHQAPLSMGFSRQEFWSGVPLPSPDGGVTELKLCPFDCLSAKPIYWHQFVKCLLQDPSRGIGSIQWKSHELLDSFQGRVFKSKIWGEGFRVHDFLLIG